ncbi:MULTISPECIES: ROK family transcriptional regulator [Alteromonas]|uniref:HTH marR-type domain-containing protein n=1 Tax=Alteromonas mediterranea TaxID=314275 RepID=A0AAC9NRG5_9ALTE|nr:ROK family transcriptional regulator [Alteromonas mediterranea]APD89539.1 hypothetical protein BM524_06885 [Alteromonas mediterranea]
MGQQSGSNSSGIRRFNERLILTMLSKHGPLSKTELSEVTELTKQAVVRIVDILHEKGLVILKSKRVTGKGRPSELYALNTKGAYSIGVMIGRREVKIVLMDIGGNIVDEAIESYGYPEPHDLVVFITRHVPNFLGQLNNAQRQRLKGLGVAMPWFLGRWSDGKEMPVDVAQKWESFDIKKELEDELNMPIYVSNDCTSAAAAELLFGQGKKCSSYLYIYIDSFIGGGLVLKGNVEAGVHANSAALASYPVSPSNSPSLPASKRSSEILLNRASLMSLIDYLNFKGYEVDNLVDLQRGLDADNFVFDEWLNDCSQAIAELIVGSNTLLDYNAVIIDVNITGPFLSNLTEKTEIFVKELLERDIYEPQIIKGDLGKRAIMMGAAILPFYSNFAADKSVLFKANT